MLCAEINGSYKYLVYIVSVPVAARSRVKVYDRLSAAIMGSNPTAGIDVCLLCVLCVVR
jgi:hypothetical protein